MSISIVLVPLAIAGISAWKASREEVDAQGRRICQVQTRMKDQSLLAAALRDTRAEVHNAPERLTGRWQGVQVDFARDDQGIWQADFTGDIDATRAESIIVAVDAAYGRQVQQAVLARLRERAPSAGMSIASESIADDHSVTMVLNVEAR